MEVTPLASTDMQRIKAEFLREEEDRPKNKKTKKIMVVDVEALEFGAEEIGIEVGITSPFPTLHSSSSPIPSVKE